MHYSKSFISTCISVKFQYKMVVLKVLQDFANKTSIHGLVYLVSPESSSRKKIIWAISIVVAVMYATLEMRNSVIGKYLYIFRTIKWKPMLITLSNTVILIMGNNFLRYGCRYWTIFGFPRG